ncbi:ABC transporter permease [Spirillospora sp. CA-294931]|uniref:ABC transporter permease n=1 Tax=Spirillospora sp. CA-294931 TaxID=3240042 RepID=UPI003D95003D
MMVKLVLRGLAAHRTRLVLSTVAVIAGTAFVAGTLIFSATLERTFDHAFADLGRGTDVVVRPVKAFDDGLGARASERTVPASVLPAVRRADGVAKADGAVSGFAAVIDGKGRIVGPEPQTGAAWSADPDLSLMRLRSGRPPGNAGEIALGENIAKEAGHRVGDRVTVALSDGTRTFTLVGVFQYGASTLADMMSIVAFEPGTANRLLMERPGTFERISVHAEDGVSQERLRESVAAALPAGYEAVTGAKAIDELAEPLREVFAALRMFLLVFAVIAVFVGSFLIFNTFAMLVARRTRELALLRAVGASRGQVTRSVLGEAAGVGFAGATLGLVAGAGLALGLAELMSVVAGDELPFGEPVYPLSAVVSTYAVGVLVTLAAAFVPARRASRVPPVAALRDEVAVPARSLRIRAVAGAVIAVAGSAAMIAGVAASGRTALTLAGGGALAFFAGVTVLGPVLSRPLAGLLGAPFARFGGMPGRIGRRNARRNPRQTAAAASALTVGMALVATVSVINASMAASVERQLDAGLTADYLVTGRSAVSPVGPKALDAVSRAEGVRTAVPIRTARFALGGTVHSATAGAPRDLAAHFRLKVEAGTANIKGDELLVSRTTAASNGWTVGGSVPGRYQDGARATFRIAGVYADVETIVPTVPTMIINAAGYRANDPGTTLDRVELTVAPGTSRAALESALAPWPNLKLQDRAEVKDEAGAQIDMLLQIVLALLALSVIVAALGIVNTLALSVIERTREIGLLRAVGMERRELRRMIRYEAVIVSVLGAVLGLGIGLLSGVAVQNAMASDQGLDVLAIPYGRLALYLLGAGLIGVVAAAWPAHQAARTKILHAIA